MLSRRRHADRPWRRPLLDDDRVVVLCEAKEQHVGRDPLALPEKLDQDPWVLGDGRPEVRRDV